MRASAGNAIRVGVGGWTYEPWRGTFYPPGLPHTKELEYASRQLTALEINGTYYSTMRPQTYAKWRDETPDDFVFTLKAHRYATTRKQLATAADAVAHFLGSGITALGPKLGPIVWQFMPTKRFDAQDFEGFLKLLPPERDGLRLQHVLDVRHESFACEAYMALARRYGCTTVHTDAERFPSIADAQGDLAYLRLMRSQAELPTGYPSEVLDQWAQGAREWVAQRQGGRVYAFFINGAKERAPAAALELIRRVA